MSDLCSYKLKERQRYKAEWIAARRRRAKVTSGKTKSSFNYTSSESEVEVSMIISVNIRKPQQLKQRVLK
jgi:hypothetical protein